jgi:hypothetical protein
MKWLPWTLATILAAFTAVTVWAVTVNGILEPAKLDVDYFYCGAGDNILLLRLFLAFCASCLSVSWAILQKAPVWLRLARLAIAPAVILVLAGSVKMLDRYAPSYSENAFMDLASAHRKGEVVTVAEVRARLGNPLMTASRPAGLTIWSYTFTPSGGFGWPKRTLTFDSQGVVVDFLHLDEP